MKRGPTKCTRTVTLFPYRTVFRSQQVPVQRRGERPVDRERPPIDRRDGCGQAHAGDQPRRIRPAQCRYGYGLIGRLEAARSEERTSELQSLMRSSYVVICLKKTKIDITL